MVKIYIQNHTIWKIRSHLERDEIEGIAVKRIPKKAKRFYVFVISRLRICPKFFIQSLAPCLIICCLNYLSKSVFSWKITKSTF